MLLFSRARFNQQAVHGLYGAVFRALSVAGGSHMQAVITVVSFFINFLLLPGASRGLSGPKLTSIHRQATLIHVCAHNFHRQAHMSRVRNAPHLQLAPDFLLVLKPKANKGLEGLQQTICRGNRSARWMHTCEVRTPEPANTQWTSVLTICIWR